MRTMTLRLYPSPPFDFELTASYHTYFQARSGADTMADGVYRRLLDLDGKLALASAQSVGSMDAPEILVELRGDALTDADTALAASQLEWMLGCEQDLRPFYDLAASDPPMAGLAENFSGLHLPRTATLFESLMLAILGQQISASVARAMRLLIIQRFGEKAEFDGVTYFAFPRPEVIAASTPEELRTLKLTQRKSEYIHGIALAAHEPEWAELPQLPDDEFVSRMIQLRGIGRWTAQWALVRGLARPDALPLGDLALRRGVSRLLRDGESVTDVEVERLAERWRPWRSYATAYLFAAMRTGMV